MVKNKTEPGTAVGKLLREGRENLRPALTQAAFASKHGVSTQTYSVWERQALHSRSTLPTRAKLLEMAADLHIPSKRMDKAWTELMKARDDLRDT